MPLKAFKMKHFTRETKDIRRHDEEDMEKIGLIENDARAFIYKECLLTYQHE
jgi:hypothetical protein